MGWAGLDNGELLARAEKDFDIFITAGNSLWMQNHLMNLTADGHRFVFGRNGREMPQGHKKLCLR